MSSQSVECVKKTGKASSKAAEAFYRVFTGQPCEFADEPRESEDKSGGECVVCMDREPTHAFLPCGHKATCGECSTLVDRCPNCRAHIVERKRIYEN